MASVANPILPGFHPDPSILRVGEWYYLANSTFEWWPGVRIHRSRDLANWELAGYALTRRSQLDLRGNPDSGGVWAPCLSHADGRFWLIYSDAKSLNGPFKDVRNYLVTAERIEGPWSEPDYLNCSGFDPSLFHDDDGRKWLVNQLWDPRPGRNAFAGIVLQEYSVAERRLVGEPVNIFRGSPLGITEGPHLYCKDGYYYLVTAEGGTGWDHAVTVARSRTLTGPYEVSPQHPLLTARGRPEHPLQKTGHGSFVSAPDGRWFVAFLCSRPVGPKRRCILGRETGLLPFAWPEGGWPQLAPSPQPAAAVELPEMALAPGYLPTFADDFSATELGPQWNTLREPATPDWLSLTERPGFLRLRGRHSLNSAFDQSLVGFRLLHQRCTITTRLEFNPRSFQQTAGLALYYNTGNFYYACVSRGDGGGRELRVLAAVNGRFSELLTPAFALPETGAVVITAALADGALRFSVGVGDTPVTEVVAGLDATTVSDDHVMEGAGWGFTGAFAVLCAQDSGDVGIPADFASFHYRRES
jgi:xylan 1,4-beta-xylosidase